MSASIKLLICENHDSTTIVVKTILPLEPFTNVVASMEDAIEKKGKPLGICKLFHYPLRGHDECFEDQIVKDEFGNDVELLLPSQALRVFIDNPKWVLKSVPINKAAYAYLQALPDDRYVVAVYFE